MKRKQLKTFMSCCSVNASFNIVSHGLCFVNNLGLVNFDFQQEKF